MISHPNKILVICGPTSTGKTSLALDLAKETSAIVISADSRQIYKYMDIGTGKLPVLGNHKVIKQSDFWIVDGTEVYGYDLVKPDRVYSAAEFCAYSQDVIEKVSARNKRVIVVGGTGFYIDMLTGKTQSSGVAPDKSLRATLNSLSLETLQEKLKLLSLEIYQKIDIKNKVRVIRAVENLTLQPSISNLKTSPFDTEFVYLGLKAPNEYMYKKADMWAESVWNKGLLNEAENLIKRGYADTPPLNGLIYKTVVSYLNGSTVSGDALQRVKFDLHAYIRRQLTWFKRNPDIHWYDISVLSKDQIKHDALAVFSV